MTNKMFLDLRMVTLVTPVTCLRPSFDIACRKNICYKSPHNMIDKCHRNCLKRITEDPHKSYPTFRAFFSLRLCLALLTGSSSISAAAASCWKTFNQSMKDLFFLFNEQITFIYVALLRTEVGFSKLRRTKVTVSIITEESITKIIYIYIL